MSTARCDAIVGRALATIVLTVSAFLTPVSNVSTSMLLLRTNTVFHDRDSVEGCLGILCGIPGVDFSSSAGWVGRLRGGGRAWIRKTITKERKKETQRKKRNIGNTNLVASVSVDTMCICMSNDEFRSLMQSITGQT